MDITTTMDPELRAAFAQLPPIHADQLDFVALRKVTDEMYDAFAARLPKNERVAIQDHLVPGPVDAPDVPVRLYAPVSRTGLLPGVFWIHGGGFTGASPKVDDLLMARFVEEVNCVVVSVEYRLAPEYPFPAASEDCYAALMWTTTHANDLGIHPERLAIAGMSSGGGLCVAVALMVLDRGERLPCFQMPLHACLDDRHITSSSYEITDPRVWHRELSLQAWKAYLGATLEGDVSPYAAPSRATSLAGLPPTYICVGELDLVRDENIAYAQRLMQAGVPTELHIYPGAFHSFEIQVPSAAISQRALKEYIGALKRALYR